MTSSTYKECYGIFIPRSGLPRSGGTAGHPFVDDPMIRPDCLEVVVGGLKTERDLPRLVSVSDKASLGEHVHVPMLRRVGSDLTVLANASAPSLLVVGGGILINGPATSFTNLRFIGGKVLYREGVFALPVELNTDSQLRRRILPQLHAMGIGTDAAFVRALQFEVSEGAGLVLADEAIETGPDLGL